MTTFRAADALGADALDADALGGEALAGDGAEVPDAARDLPAIIAWVNAMPLARALCLECTAIEPGRSTFEMTPPEAWRNPNGSIAGAAFLGATDYAAGMAAVSVTGADDYVSTVDLGLHFLRPAMVAPLAITSTVLREGRRLIFLEQQVHDGDGTLVATGLGTFSVARGRGLRYPIGARDPIVAPTDR